MSRSLPGNQVEHAFTSHRLGNWETPNANAACKNTSAASRWSTLQERSSEQRTEFVAESNGHLKEGVPKVPKSAFNTQPAVYDKTPARWPQPNPAIKANTRATMGYKGIQTDYLPRNTTIVKTSELPMTREANYNFL